MYDLYSTVPVVVAGLRVLKASEAADALQNLLGECGGGGAKDGEGAAGGQP